MIENFDKILNDLKELNENDESSFVILSRENDQNADGNMTVKGDDTTNFCLLCFGLFKSLSELPPVSFRAAAQYIENALGAECSKRTMQSVFEPFDFDDEEDEEETDYEYFNNDDFFSQTESFTVIPCKKNGHCIGGIAVADDDADISEFIVNSVIKDKGNSFIDDDLVEEIFIELDCRNVVFGYLKPDELPKEDLKEE